VTLAEDALDRARAAEAALTSGVEIGPLRGVPLTIKDTIDTEGMRTTSGSRVRANYVPDRDATAVARLKAAGAIIIGKTNTPEMAIPYETDNQVFGRTNNPYDLNRTSGGSSGGEAAAIAAGLSPAGLGSDLSGSIRVPAHFCGIVGLKPTTGRVSMDGHLPAATGALSLGAAIGPMARRTEDLALLFRVIAEPTQYEVGLAGAERFTLPTISELGRTRVVWYTNDGVALVDEEISRAVEVAANSLSQAGLEVVEATPPGVSEGSRLWVELFGHAATQQMREFYRGKEDEAGPQVTALLRESGKGEISREERIEAAETLAKAVQERERLREELLRWMKTTPILVAPVGATCAFEHGARRVKAAGELMSVFRAFSYSQTFNVLGFPTVAVPAGRSREGLPIGVQVVGRPFEERTVIAVAGVVEQALGGWQQPSNFP
jgi:amidase